MLLHVMKNLRDQILIAGGQTAVYYWIPLIVCAQLAAAFEHMAAGLTDE